MWPPNTAVTCSSPAPAPQPTHFPYVVLMQAQEPLVHPLSLGEKRSLGGQQVVNSAARGEARAPVQLPPAPIHPVAHGPRALLCPRPTGGTGRWPQAGGHPLQRRGCVLPDLGLLQAAVSSGCAAEIWARCCEQDSVCIHGAGWPS